MEKNPVCGEKKTEKDKREIIDQVYSALQDGLLYRVTLVGIGGFIRGICMYMLDKIDKTSTTDRIDVKMSKK